MPGSPDYPLPPRTKAKSARPDRAGKRVIAGHFEELEYRRFKVLIAKRGWTTEAGVRFAIYEMFRLLDDETAEAKS